MHRICKKNKYHWMFACNKLNSPSPSVVESSASAMLDVSHEQRCSGVGTAFPHLFHVLLWNKLEAVLKWLFFGCVLSHFLLALHSWWRGAGPVLSRFYRFLLIGPRAEGSHALRLFAKANVHFLWKLLVYGACAESSIFQVVLRDQNVFPTDSQNAV